MTEASLDTLPTGIALADRGPDTEPIPILDRARARRRHLPHAGRRITMKAPVPGRFLAALPHESRPLVATLPPRSRRLRARIEPGVWIASATQELRHREWEARGGYLQALDPASAWTQAAHVVLAVVSAVAFTLLWVQRAGAM